MKKFDKVYSVELSPNKIVNSICDQKLDLKKQFLLNRSSIVISDSENRNNSTTSFLIKNSKPNCSHKKLNFSIKKIENSTYRVEEVETIANDFLKFPFLNSLYALAICNINSDSNIHLILKAFKSIKNRRVVIIGNWDASAFGRSLKTKCAKYVNIILLDEINDPRVLNLLIGNAILYIQSNNLRKSDSCLFEAMSHSIPVLAYKATYNFIATGYEASYFLSSDNIISFLKVSTMESLKKNSILMKEISDRKFRLRSIA
jgi:glycosyltransferase involved in cell wall biosynthesis